MLHTFSARAWNEQFSPKIQQDALEMLERGSILYLPQLSFDLKAEELSFLSPVYADPHAKNISFHAAHNKLWGVRNLTDQQHMQLKAMLDRFSRHALELLKGLLPRYSQSVEIARTSFRPVQISGRITSSRKDDKRLHVDAFPSAPNQGKRILRIFCNINPHGEDRIWRVGEPFEQVALRFLPQASKPFPASAAMLRCLKITKSYRTLYDHYMLQMHDRMKRDEAYQINAKQEEIRFQPGSTWIVQTDHVSHAAMQGQHVLEQTFYLPVEAMENAAHSPLRVLERLIGQTLV